MISLREFRNIGREQRYAQRSPLVHAFTWLFGPIGIHSRIRTGHVLRLIRQIDLPEDARVLDAGCGRGLVLFSLALDRPAYHLHGIEVDPELVLQARAVAAAMRCSHVTFEQGDLSTVKSVGGPYDLIVSIDVLEHIKEDARVLSTLRQAMKPNGALILHLPLRHQEQRRIFAAFRNHIVSDHVRDEYTPAEIEAKLEEAGFLFQHLRHGFGWQGELAFELNTLFWSVPPLRAVLALLTYPLSWWMAYWDVRSSSVRGNSLIVVARPRRGSGN